MFPIRTRHLFTVLASCLVLVPLASPAQATSTAATSTAATSPAGRARAAELAALREEAAVAKTPAAHPSRGAVRTRPAARLTLRTRPGHVTRAHYLRNLTGRATDRRAMRTLGAHDAATNPGGMVHHVLLDIGGQVANGVHLSTTSNFLSYAGLVRAVTAFVIGYDSRQRANAPAVISIGTNNDLLTSADAGRRWARQVVNQVRARTKGCTGITIAGANDVEPGFTGGPAASRAWLHGYLANTTAPFVFNGSADGCSPSRPLSGCNNGWTARDLAALAGTMAPSRIYALPQVYNPDMAGQWAQISRTAKLTHHRPLRIVGPLTETTACGRDASCPTMPSASAWRWLWSELGKAHVRARSLPAQVDLDVR